MEATDRGLAAPLGMGTGGGGDSGGGGRRGVGGLTTSGGKSIVPIKSVISVQSKHLADHVNSVYDSQITYTTKIHNQRSRIEDLAFRIARTDKELVSPFLTAFA